MKCERCGAAGVPGAKYCGVCGNVFVPHVDQIEIAEAGARHARETWIVRAFAVVALIIVIELIAGLAQIAPEHHARQTAAKLTAATDSLKKAQTDLTIRTKERDELYAKANRIGTELDDAKKSASFQGNQLTAFRSCLNAIRDVGVAQLRGDTAAIPGLIRDLDKACAAAERLL